MMNLVMTSAPLAMTEAVAVRDQLKKIAGEERPAPTYNDMDSSLEGTLTLYAPADNDRMIVNVNDTKAQVIGVSFYDCRKGGNGSATGFAWLRDIGSRYL